MQLYKGHDSKHAKCERTEQRTDEVGAQDGQHCGSHVAPETVLLRVGYGNVPPNGQGDGEEDGDRVARLREEGVEVYNDRPSVRALLLATDCKLPKEVLVEAVRDVVEHDEEIGNGQSRENGVCGRAHVPPGQHCNVEAVGDAAKDAHKEADEAVDVVVAKGKVLVGVFEGKGV